MAQLGVERRFALLSERKIKRASHLSTRELERDIRDFLQHTNDHSKPFIWTKSADQILASFRRFCQYTLESQGKYWKTSENFRLRTLDLAKGTPDSRNA